MKYLLFIVLGVVVSNVRGQVVPGPDSGGGRKALRPYSSVITRDAVAYRGLFTVYQVRDSFFFEIPDTLLNRDMLVINRYVQTPYQKPPLIPLFNRKYPGEMTGVLGVADAVYFALGKDSVMNLCRDIQKVQAEPNSRLADAVAQAENELIMNVLPVAAIGPSGHSFVVDVNTFLTSTTVTGLPKLGKENRFHVEYVHAYPMNVELGIYQESSYDGSISVVNASFMALPRTPMPQRLSDRRVGLFSANTNYFSDDQQAVEKREFILRWRMEPRPEDRERWRRGELVEPEKPIVIYIDPHTPKQWVKYLILGINDWQKAFEQAGFRNAIMGREWPYGDSANLDDARYSFICYLPSETMNAYGPQVHDPRSGEIIQTHIGWYHNVMTLVDYWYRSQVGATDPSARRPTFDDELMGQLIRFVSSHEVGHTLGLRHNFGSSSRTPVEKMRDKDWLKQHGHTASIMDYARFNYVAQPEDSVPQECLWPHIGEYDRWAIQWAYRYTGLSVGEDKKGMSRLATDSLAANPRLWFGSQEAERGPGDPPEDPRCQAEDLGDNNMVANTYGIGNLKRVLPALPKWTKEEGGLYDNLGDAYAALLGQYKRYIGHVMTNIGGVERTYRCEDTGGDVYAPVTREQQQQALAFLNEELFVTPVWLLDPTVTNKVRNPRITDEIAQLQRHQLKKLLAYEVFDKLLAARTEFGDSLAYLAEDYLSDVHRYIWGGLAAGGPMDVYRRGLQKSYITALGELVAPHDPAVRETDTWSVARADMERVAREVRAAIPRYAAGAEKEHLESVLMEINKILKYKL
jgi:hypothetical protein